MPDGKGSKFRRLGCDTYLSEFLGLIPEALADVVGLELRYPLVNGFVQSNTVNRTLSASCPPRLPIPLNRSGA